MATPRDDDGRETRFGLRHIATGEYLATNPDFDPYRLTADPDDAVSWSNREQAEMYLVDLADPTAHEVVTLRVLMPPVPAQPLGSSIGSELIIEAELL